MLSVVDIILDDVWGSWQSYLFGFDLDIKVIEECFGDDIFIMDFMVLFEIFEEDGMIMFVFLDMDFVS